MTDQKTSVVASDAEIEAALAEAEAATAGIPSLDQDPSAAVVVVPVPTQPGLRSLPKPDGPKPKKVTVRATAEETPNAPEAVSAPGRVCQFLGKLGRIVYQASDTGLWALNRPFERMGGPARQMTGLLATVSILMSLLAMYLLPTLFPTRDTVTELRQRSAELRESLPADEPGARR